MSGLFKNLFKSTTLNVQDTEIINLIKSSLASKFDYEMEFTKRYIIIKVKRE